MYARCRGPVHHWHCCYQHSEQERIHCIGKSAIGACLCMCVCLLTARCKVLRCSTPPANSSCSLIGSTRGPSFVMLPSRARVPTCRTHSTQHEAQHAEHTVKQWKDGVRCWQLVCRQSAGRCAAAQHVTQTPTTGQHRHLTCLKHQPCCTTDVPPHCNTATHFCSDAHHWPALPCRMPHTPVPCSTVQFTTAQVQNTGQHCHLDSPKGHPAATP